MTSIAKTITATMNLEIVDGLLTPTTSAINRRCTIIIVEGADKVGKTTLCKKLAERLNTQVCHFGLLPPDWDFFWDYEQRASLNAVWDRGWLSEVAYQQITGRKPRFSQNHRALVIDMLRLHGAINVVITASPDLLMRRLSTENDDKFDVPTVMAVNDWYVNNYVYYPTDQLIHCTSRQPYPPDFVIEELVELHRRKACVIEHVIGEGLCLSQSLKCLGNLADIAAETRSAG